MKITPFNEVDYLEQARERYTEQFKNKDVFDRYIRLLTSTKIEIQSTLKDLIQQRTLETAVGAQLDVIGDIVGQPRELIEADLFQYFGFRGENDAGSLGDINDKTIGALFWELGTPSGGNVLLNDNVYRLFIKAKIIKNTTTSTSEEFIHMINFLFGTSTVFLFTEGYAEFTIFFGRELSSFERVLLTYTSDYQGYKTNFLPRPAGVEINFAQFFQDNYFGFQGTPGSKGFGGKSGVIGGYGQAYGESYGEAVPIEPTGDGGLFAEFINV